MIVDCINADCDGEVQAGPPWSGCTCSICNTRYIAEEEGDGSIFLEKE